MAVLGHISSKPVKKITWASYGSHPDSWFFSYEMVDGMSDFQVGAAIPPALQQFVDRIRLVDDLRSNLRVQLGDSGSFVAWAKTSWACYGVPAAVEAELCQLSGAHMKSSTATKGSLKTTLTQVTWHGDGSYFIEDADECLWSFKSSVTKKAWDKVLSGRDGIVDPTMMEELVVSTTFRTALASN